MTRIEIPFPQQTETRQPSFKFTERPDGIYEVEAETTQDHIAAFRNVTEELDDHYWAQAAVAASLSKKFSDKEVAKHAMEELAEAVELSPSYLRQMARTYCTFTESFSREKKLYFNHHRIAAYAVNPERALAVAVEQGMSCRALEDWVSEDNRKRAGKITRKRKSQVTTDFLQHLEHVESVIESDFIATCPSRDFASRVYREWLSQIKFELRQLLRGANQDKVRAAIEDEGARNCKQIKDLTSLPLCDVEAVVGMLVAQNEYEWIDRGGKGDDQRGVMEKILHKVGTADGGGYSEARSLNQYTH